MGRNKSFFSLLGPWETFLSLGDSADALGGFGKLWGGFGRLWEALGSPLEALGRPAAEQKTTIYKNVGSKQTPDKPALLAHVNIVL